MKRHEFVLLDCGKQVVLKYVFRLASRLPKFDQPRDQRDNEAIKHLEKQSVKNSSIMVLIVLAFCVGCGGDSSSETEVARTPAELVDSAISESQEFNFCLSEDAGEQSLKECVDRLQAIVETLPDSVSKSEVAQAQKEKFTNAFDELKVAFESLANAVSTSSTAPQMSKANSKLYKKLKTISESFK